MRAREERLVTAGADPSSHDDSGTFWRLALLVIVLLAFGLRAYRLDFQSLWSDEGISLQRAQMALPATLEATPDEHTPGHVVRAHGWALSGWPGGGRPCLAGGHRGR